MMKQEETIQYVASLAKLSLTEEEKARLGKEFERILEYMNTMDELDTEGIEPMSHVLPVKNVFREDVITNGDDRDQLLVNAPFQKDGSFLVPKTVE